MKSFALYSSALIPALLFAGLGLAHAQQQENVAWENSKAIAYKTAAVLLERQTGSKGLPLSSFAVEVDLNLDGFPEIFAYRFAPACDGTECGNFLFVLQGDSYNDVLGDIPGARLVPQDKIGLGAFKRNGFLDIQIDQLTIGWDGSRYVAASTFPASTLDGTAFLAACRKSKSSEQPAEGEAGQASADCQCQFNRFQVIGFTQADLDTYTASLGGDFEYPEGEKEAAWNVLLNNAEDVGTGCDVAGGKSQWQTATLDHGDRPQQKLTFDGFLDACRAQDFILANRKVGSPDRAVGLCGCLAREMPTHGIDQARLDLLTRYYLNEMSDADVETQDADALTLHDKASEACLARFPAK
jgi:hypothetical protein